MHSFQKLQLAILIFLAPSGALFSQSSTINFEAPVDYTAALNLAIDHNPRLLGIEATIEAAEGQIDQAKLRPNPTISGELENVIGTGPYSGVQGVEMTLGIRQLIETADKRAKRTSLARSNRDLVDWQREAILAEIEAETRSRFIDVLLAQKVASLREEQLELAKRSMEATEELVNAARSPQVELTRANLVIREQQFALDQSARALLASRNALSAQWGMAPSPEFIVSGEVVLERTLPEFKELILALSKTATLAQFEALARSREAALELEQARATPDFEVFGGGRYFNEESGDAAFVIGVEIPWPLFDKNQGNIRTARAQLRAVEFSRKTLHRTLMSELSDAFQTLTNAHADALSVESDLLPAAEQTLAETEAGYQRGQFKQLSVLESRRTLFQIRETYLEALTRYSQAQAAIGALTRSSTFNKNN